MYFSQLVSALENPVIQVVTTKELKKKRMQKTAETVNKIMKTIPQKMENGKELCQCVNCGKWFEPCRTTFDESGKCLNVCGEFTCSYDCTEELSRKGVI